MANVRVLQPIAGLDFSWAPGEVVEISEKLAALWAIGGLVEHAEPAKTARTTAARKSRGGSRSSAPETR